MMSDALCKLRRLRILQRLATVAPAPMGEMALLDSLRTDPELSPTVDRVRDSMRYLAGHDLVELITASGSDWMAGRLTRAGKAWLEEPGDHGLAIYSPAEKPEHAPARAGRRGRVSFVVDLTPEAKAWLDQELIRRGFTGYEEIAAQLIEQGFSASRSAVGRYGKQLKEDQRQLRQSIEVAKALAEVVGDDGAAMNQTLTALAQQELMAIIREGRYDDEIKLPALVQSVAQLNRSDINTRKFQIEQAARRKALEEAAETAEKSLAGRGMSRQAVADIKREILGIG